jgi:hypoxanthine phosphoribosyltransferase
LGNEKEEEIMATHKLEYLSDADMNSYYAEVCRAMAGAQYRPDVIIALSRGGLDFGVKLSNWFGDVALVPLVWQTRDGAIKEIDKLAATLSKYKGTSILIVDDILDSGETLKQIDLLCSNVEYAVAIENTEADFETTWSGRQIQRSEHAQWFIFPWEAWWR